MKTLKNMLKNLKKDKKGFTLVEIVIVIVIIAILAAMLVPSLIAWIDNANQKSFMEACNTIRSSAFGNAAENYAINGSTDPDWDKVSNLVGKEVGTTGDVEYTVSNFNYSEGKITVSNAKYTSTYDGSKWTDPEPAK